MGTIRTLSAVAAAAGLLTLSSGCMIGDALKGPAKKPDAQSGAPKELSKTTLTQGQQPAAGQVAPAGGVQPIAPTGGPPAPKPDVWVAEAQGAKDTGPKFSLKPERKVVATDLAVAWRGKVEYLPDPEHNGKMSPGLAGQMFLYGGLKMEPADPSGTLTVDLVDETPRPPGQPAATPQSWKFDKHVLRSMRTNDETFGRSYVLFLPWPSYKPDITRVKISGRYDPENGHTLFITPTTVTITTEAPVWDGTNSSGAKPQPFGANGPLPAPMGGGVQPQPQPQPNLLPPIQLGGPRTDPIPNFVPNAIPPAGYSPNAVPPAGFTPGTVSPIGAVQPPLPQPVVPPPAVPQPVLPQPVATPVVPEPVIPAPIVPSVPSAVSPTGVPSVPAAPIAPPASTTPLSPGLRPLDGLPPIRQRQ